MIERGRKKMGKWRGKQIKQRERKERKRKGRVRWGFEGLKEGEREDRRVGGAEGQCPIAQCSHFCSVKVGVITVCLGIFYFIYLFCLSTLHPATDGLDI